MTQSTVSLSLDDYHILLHDAQQWRIYAKKKQLQNMDKKCHSCGDSFETGVGTGRRFDAIYCSNECKTKYHSRARSK